MTAPIVLRVRLDRSEGHPFYGCDSCPMSDQGDAGRAPQCMAVKRELSDFLYCPAPAWCPLRTGPVTVEGAGC